MSKNLRLNFEEYKKLQEKLNKQSKKIDIETLSNKKSKGQKKAPSNLKEGESENQSKPKKRKSLDFNEVIKNLKEAKFELKIINQNNDSDNKVADSGKENKKELSIMIYDIRLVTLNEIFATLQSRPYEIYRYKKACHELIERILEKDKLNKNLPIFNKVRLTLYRKSPRYIDQDALAASCKYFTDALVRSGVMKDDNPMILKEIVPIQEKGKDKVIGIKLEEIES